MSERLLYEHLKRYFKSNGAEIDFDEVTFMVIAAAESDTQVQLAAKIIDPRLPENLPGAPYDRPMAQQIIIYLRQTIKPALEAAKDMAVALTGIVKRLGSDRVGEIVAASDTPEEFTKAVMKEIERHGTG